MSGLAAGIRLAYFNKKVCILEKHYRPGGLNSYYNYKGYRLDVGLHAMTNYAPKGKKGAPLTKLLKQLKLKHHDFGLCEQTGSAISFPNVTLNFSNDLKLLENEIFEKFPDQIDNFKNFCHQIKEFNDVDLSIKSVSARDTVSSFITNPLLVEMLFCPLSFYGSARENDMDFEQFVTMFKSIFFEGFSRPLEGVRKIIKCLLNKYSECGGELRLKTGVKAININSSSKGGEYVCSVDLENGERIEAKKVISTIGYVETMQLVDPGIIKGQIGNLSFVEMIYILNKRPNELGIDKTIVFYNDSEKFLYRKPDNFVDVDSGVICCPTNFQFSSVPQDSIIRTTHIANFSLWNNLSPKEYFENKKMWMEKSLQKLSTIIPDFSSSIYERDMFTPKTISKFTGHLHGSVYGSPHKHKNGITHIKNLFICGTDQGFMGITGAMLSGISIANLHAML